MGHTQTGSQWLARAWSVCNGATRPRGRSSICSATSDFVVRYNGGANAGHTVVVDGKTFKLSLLPTGVLRPNVTLGHRQRRRRLPAAVPRRGRPTRARAGSTSATTSLSATTPTSSSPITWRKSDWPKATPREDRHDRPRHRPLLPGQGRPALRHPRRRIAQPGAPPRTARTSCRFKNRLMAAFAKATADASSRSSRRRCATSTSAMRRG